MTATDDHKALVRRLFEVGVNQRDVRVFAEVLAEDLQAENWVEFDLSPLQPG